MSRSVDLFKFALLFSALYAAFGVASLAADQTFADAALQNRLENAAQKIALAEAAVPVLREG